MTTYRRVLFFLLLGLIMVVEPGVAIITRTYTFRIKIPNMNMMRIITPGVPNGIINLELHANEAGAPLDMSGTAVNNASWMQITSIVPVGETRNVSVELTNGTRVPLGTILKLTASDCLTGDGAHGTTHTIESLTHTTSYLLISDIGSCYTGATTQPPYSGYNLTYTWKPDPDNIDKLVPFSSYQIYIMYTFSAD